MLFNARFPVCLVFASFPVRFFHVFFTRASLVVFAYFKFLSVICLQVWLAILVQNLLVCWKKNSTPEWSTTIGVWTGGGASPHLLSWGLRVGGAPTFAYNFREFYPPVYSRSSSRRKSAVCILWVL